MDDGIAVKLGIMLVWLVVSVVSVNLLDRSLRVYILDYEVKRPKILRTIIVAMIWLLVSIGCIVWVLID
ncbi:MAG: hypothetical protein GXY61_00995 [Lentisphaerae bacterium]|jgi:hypothetical protein|nr:hypothetical protein [Lentisphaerota bacterium]